MSWRDEDRIQPPAVELEPLSEIHSTAMFRWMCDPVVAENIGLSRPPSLESTREWIRNATEATDTAPFAILYDGRHVGNVVLDRIDSRLSTARLSVYLGEADARGSGIGRTAILLALNAAFVERDLEKVWLTAHARNVAAIRTYIGVGFRLEGIHRGEFLLGEKRIDEVYMGILREEFTGGDPGEKNAT
jgi:RimJ/RimL family protein N-acetyltransferase